MFRKKYTSLFFTALAIAVSLFTASQAGATCQPDEIAALTCLDTGGFEVRTTPFPTQNDDGTTTFNYTIAPLPGTAKNVSTLDMLVPLCNVDFNSDGIVDNLILISTGDPNGWRMYPAGQGSSNTNYGLGVTQFTVFEQNFSSSTAASFYLHTTKAVSGATSLGLKIGSQLFYSSILGPACFMGKTASTTAQIIQVDPLISEKTVTVLKNADGSFAQDSSSLFDSQVWVCSNPILNSDGTYASCNDPLTQLTFISDGSVLKFGKHSMIRVSGTSGGTPTCTCYCCKLVSGKYSCPLVGCNTYCP